MNQKTLKRFHRKIDTQSSPRGCHLWTAHLNNKGYGAFWLRGRVQLAHRAAWQIANGEIPIGMFVLHRCDTPQCVNPNHLFLGTLADNTADMVQKSRNDPSPGAKNGRAKLTPDMVAHIRRSTEPNSKLACRFGVSPRAVYHVRAGTNWRHTP